MQILEKEERIKELEDLVVKGCEELNVGAPLGNSKMLRCTLCTFKPSMRAYSMRVELKKRPPQFALPAGMCAYWKKHILCICVCFLTGVRVRAREACACSCVTCVDASRVCVLAFKCEFAFINKTSHTWSFKRRGSRHHHKRTSLLAARRRSARGSFRKPSRPPHSASCHSPSGSCHCASTWTH